jgi:hypothetical protein
MRGEKKTDSVTLRLTSEQKQQIERCAADLGISSSEFCRRMLVGEEDDDGASPKARVAQKRRR